MAEIDAAFPQWNNVTEQLLVLRDCNYSLADALAFGEDNFGWKLADSMPLRNRFVLHTVRRTRRAFHPRAAALKPQHGARSTTDARTHFGSEGVAGVRPTTGRQLHTCTLTRFTPDGDDVTSLKACKTNRIKCCARLRAWGRVEGPKCRSPKRTARGSLPSRTVRSMATTISIRREIWARFLHAQLPGSTIWSRGFECC